MPLSPVLVYIFMWGRWAGELKIDDEMLLGSGGIEENQSAIMQVRRLRLYVGRGATFATIA